MEITNIFMFGSINLTKLFGVTEPSQVARADLHPFLYKAKSGDLYLNITLRPREEASQWGHTHRLLASAKGKADTVILCELKELQSQNKEQPHTQVQETAKPKETPRKSDGNYNNLPF